jgi:hypothetical protein
LNYMIPYGIVNNMAMPEKLSAPGGSSFWHRLELCDSIWNRQKNGDARKIICSRRLRLLASALIT